MKITRLLLISMGCIAVMLAVSAWAYSRLPDGLIAVHWGIDGRPNGFVGRTQAVLIIPLLAVGISLLMAALPPLMPRRSRLERSARPYAVTWIGVLLVLEICHVAILAKGMGAPFDIARPVTIAIAVLIVVIGNYMGKIRYNYVFGMRTPWTLSDERVWDKTHRVVGRWMVALGLVLALVTLLAPRDRSGMTMLIVATLVCSVIPAMIGLIYSIQLSRRLERV